MFSAGEIRERLARIEREQSDAAPANADDIEDKLDFLSEQATETEQG